MLEVIERVADAHSHQSRDFFRGSGALFEVVDDLFTSCAHGVDLYFRVMESSLLVFHTRNS